MAELLERISSRELTEWSLLYRLKDEERERAQHGDVIVHDPDARSLEEDDPGEDDEDDDGG